MKKIKEVLIITSLLMGAPTTICTVSDEVVKISENKTVPIARDTPVIYQVRAPKNIEFGKQFTVVTECYKPAGFYVAGGDHDPGYFKIKTIKINGVDATADKNKTWTEAGDLDSKEHYNEKHETYITLNSDNDYGISYGDTFNVEISLYAMWHVDESPISSPKASDNIKAPSSPSADVTASDFTPAPQGPDAKSVEFNLNINNDVDGIKGPTAGDDDNVKFKNITNKSGDVVTDVSLKDEDGNPVGDLAQGDHKVTLSGEGLKANAHNKLFLNFNSDHDKVPELPVEFDISALGVDKPEVTYDPSSLVAGRNDIKFNINTTLNPNSEYKAPTDLKMTTNLGVFSNGENTIAVEEGDISYAISEIPFDFNEQELILSFNTSEAPSAPSDISIEFNTVPEGNAVGEINDITNEEVTSDSITVEFNALLNPDPSLGLNPDVMNVTAKAGEADLTIDNSTIDTDGQHSITISGLNPKTEYSGANAVVLSFAHADGTEPATEKTLADFTTNSLGLDNASKVTGDKTIKEENITPTSATFELNADLNPTSGYDEDIVKMELIGAPSGATLNTDTVVNGTNNYTINGLKVGKDYSGVGIKFTSQGGSTIEDLMFDTFQTTNATILEPEILSADIENGEIPVVNYSINIPKGDLTASPPTASPSITSVEVLDKDGSILGSETPTTSDGKAEGSLELEKAAPGIYKEAKLSVVYNNGEKDVTIDRQLDDDIIKFNKTITIDSSKNVVVSNTQKTSIEFELTSTGYNENLVNYINVVDGSGHEVGNTQCIDKAFYESASSRGSSLSATYKFKLEGLKAGTTYSDLYISNSGNTNIEFTTPLKIEDFQTLGSGLSGGAIAGIVVASLLLPLLILFLILLLLLLLTRNGSIEEEKDGKVTFKTNQKYDKVNKDISTRKLLINKKEYSFETSKSKKGLLQLTIDSKAIVGLSTNLIFKASKEGQKDLKIKTLNKNIFGKKTK